VKENEARREMASPEKSYRETPAWRNISGISKMKRPAGNEMKSGEAR